MTADLGDLSVVSVVVVVVLTVDASTVNFCVGNADVQEMAVLRHMLEERTEEIQRPAETCQKDIRQAGHQHKDLQN